MNVKIGKTTYESTFLAEGWQLVNGEEKMVISYSNIYQYFSNKIHGKTDGFTIILVITASFFLTIWILAIFLPLFFFYYSYIQKVRLDTSEGTIFVNFNSTGDKEEFLKLCKKHVTIQRWKNYNQKPDNRWVGNLINNIKKKVGL